MIPFARPIRWRWFPTSAMQKQGLDPNSFARAEKRLAKASQGMEEIRKAKA